MYRYLCGITPLEAGFAKIRIAPRITMRLEYAKAGFDSPHGMVTSSWRFNGEGRLELEAEIPVGTVGEWVFPRGDIKEIQKVFPEAVEIDSEVKMLLSPGQYKIVYMPKPPRKFTLDTPLYEFFANEKASELLCSVPTFARLPENIMLYSLKDFRDFAAKHYHYISETDDIVQKLVQMEVDE